MARVGYSKELDLDELMEIQEDMDESAWEDGEDELNFGASSWGSRMSSLDFDEDDSDY